MATICFATWDGGGNVPPALLIAAELQRRGHTVVVLGHPRQQGEITAAGLTFEPYATARPFSAIDANPVPRLIGMFGERAMGSDVVASAQRHAADLVVVDCLLAGVLDGVARAGLKYAVLEHFFDAYLRRGWLRGPLGLAMRLKGLRPTRRLDEAAVSIVAAPPELDPSAAGKHADTLRFVGPVLDAPAPRSADAHGILVSLSTYRYSGMTEVLQRVIDATADLDTRVVVTTGPAVDPSDLRPAANTELHRYVPHDELMPHVAMVVGHGGHATTMRALAHDLPLLVVPMHPMLDQPMVGKAVQKAGAGRVLKKSAGVDALRPVIAELLADGPHRAAAARLGAAIREADGRSAAADLVEAAVRNGSALPQT
jgi:UDP:flavonoid glycosyltransferase YjiC (YdhE family)